MYRFIITLIVGLVYSVQGHFLYDNSYIAKDLDDRWPYLKIATGGYVAPRDYFNFSNVFQPTQEYLESSDIEQLLYNELRAMEITSSIATMDQWYYSDKEEEKQIGSNETKCLSQLDRILEEVQLLEKHPDRVSVKGLNRVRWIRYLDSWSRPASETYWGNSYWVGSYRGCLDSELNIDDEPSKFRFCWAKLRAKSWSTRDEMIPETSFRAGICLPRTCDTALANLDSIRLKIKQILHFNFSPFHRARFTKLNHVYCLPDIERALPTSAHILCMVVTTWLTCIISVSFYTYLRPHDINQSRWRALTIQENLIRFMADDEPPSKSLDLRSLGILRFLASLATILAHTGSSFAWVFHTSGFNIKECKRLIYLFMPSLFKSVDLFMVLSSILVTYMSMVKFKQAKHFLGLKAHLFLIVGRYLRTAPPMILVLAFIKSVYPFLSHGPMWDYGTYKFSIQGSCQRSNWWRILGLPVIFGYGGQSYYNECLVATWYIIADMKFSFVTPALLYIMSRWSNRPKLLTLRLVIPLVILSALSQYKDLTMQQIIYFDQFFRYSQWYALNMLTMTYGEPGYFSVLNRMHALIIGSFAGVQLYRYVKERERNHKFQWPFWMRGRFIGAMLMYQLIDVLIPFYMQYAYLKTNQIQASEEAIKLSLVIKPRLDAIMFSIFSLRITTDLARGFMTNLKPIYKLSKLSYCIYMVHIIVISYAFSSHEYSRPNMIPMQLVGNLALVFFISFLISFPLYLLVESPISLLLKDLLMKKNRMIETKSHSKLAAESTYLRRSPIH